MDKRKKQGWQANKAFSKKSEDAGKFADVRGSAKSAENGWDGVAGWYDKLVGADGSDYHQHVILPAVMELLAIKKGDAVADVCCGQGVLVKHLLAAGAEKILGVDASEKLIAAARQRFGSEKNVSFQVADACAPGEWTEGTYDKAACVMAVHDVPDAAGLMRNISSALKTGGSVAIVMMHPCFRIPKASHWGWDADQKIQFRRLDGYGAPREISIETRPGLKTGEGTVFYHRPLAELISKMGSAGLGVIHCVELFSHRRSQVGGPFSRAEHRAAEEFPLFLGIRALKL